MSSVISMKIKISQRPVCRKKKKVFKSHWLLWYIITLADDMSLDFSDNSQLTS